VLSRFEIQPIDDWVREAKSYLAPAMPYSLRTSLTLGSGLGPVRDAFETVRAFPYCDIPHFPVSTVAGHRGELVVAKHGSRRLIILDGRVHRYEGYSWSQVTLPVRVLHALGITTMIITNASGAVSPRLKPGDIMLGLASSGLHTNGYSLARKVLGETYHELSQCYVELGRPIGEALLEPHRCYLKALKPFLPLVKGLAHITGGGFQGNIPRILPVGTAAHVNIEAWDVPPLFRIIQERGKIKPMEMYRVFNMGIGMVVITSPEKAANIKNQIPELTVIGEIIKQDSPERVILT